MNSFNKPGDATALGPEGDGLLEIQQIADDQGVTLIAIGELDISSVPELNRVLATVSDDPVNRILLDLSQLTFMDSTGLASLIAAERAAKENGQRFHLRGVQGQVHKLFDLSGFIERFTVEE